jgi:hypothetical protein
LIGRLSAMNLAKSLNVSKKTIVIIAHLCSETAVFRQNSILSFQRLIRYSRTNHAVQFCLRNRTTTHREYLMGCTVNSFQATALLTGHEKGVIFLKGHISIKNWPKRLLLRHDTSSFKGTCLLIK